MPTLLHEARPTARKDHRCSCCNGAIRVGQPYSRDTFVYDGRVYDWLTCPGCEPLRAIVWDWSTAMYDEGLGADDYREWASDNQDDPVHGEAARAFLARSAGDGA
jgi:hypothetical protein